MAGERQVNWKTLFIEGTAIIVSILLAFAIDAWWQDRKRAEDERESLELISRDLRSSIEQLEEARGFARTSSDAALRAYVALSAPGPHDAATIRPDILRVDRRTIKLPRAAYTDLVTTGNLRIIEDRALRDAIVRFYGQVDRIELIFLMNNQAILDRQWQDTFYRSGMLLPRTSDGMGLGLLDRTQVLLQSRLPEGFTHPAEPFWSLPPDSREWSSARSVAVNAALTHIVAEVIFDGLIAEAGELDALVQAWLSRNGSHTAPDAAE
ncbi:MAG: hypothetical protein R3358_04430 [Woeseiaceae bacterium]|nr:hypothetical protein [Woeseiaceae bacterium]